MAEKKDVKRYKCMNFGACAKADQGTIIEINALETIGGTPDCPHCHQHTLEEQIEKTTNWKLIGGIAAAVVVLGGAAALMFTGGEEKKPEPKKILVKQLSIVDGDITLKEGENKQLSKTVDPEKHDEIISWSSDNEVVATVDSTGNVTAVKEGTANIKVAADSSRVSASVKVTVNKSDSGEEQTRTGEKKTETSVPQPQPKNYNMGWGMYEGPMNGGMPNGFGGSIIVRRSYSIDLKKASGETVEVGPGDKIMNVKMDNGRMRQGEIHFADGTRRYISGL